VRRGVTLIEMLVVVAIAGVMAGISFPVLISGLDSFRLVQATDSTAAFLNTAVDHANRREQAMEITISTKEGLLYMRSAEPGFERKFAMPSGVTVEVLPRLAQPVDPRRFLLMPGAPAPRIGVQLSTKKGARRIVSIDPITGVPNIERPGDS
jgi:prepilin-type N-terminal cleavage/methylation domain-containing protein